MRANIESILEDNIMELLHEHFLVFISTKKKTQTEEKLPEKLKR